MEFHKNELIDETLTNYYKTFSLKLDTGDFVSEKHTQKIDKFIFKNLEKKLKEIDIYYFLTLKYSGVRLTVWQNLRVFFSGLERRFKLEMKIVEPKKKKRKSRTNHKARGNQ